MPVFRLASVDDPDARELLGEYFAMRARTFEGGDYTVSLPDPARFTPPDGVFLVVDDDLGAVGCGGVRMLDPERAEVKHLYLRDRARGRGWGRELLAELEARAVGLGARVVVLDTKHTFPPAPSAVEKALAALDVDALSPRQALEQLYVLKTLIDASA